MLRWTQSEYVFNITHLLTLVISLLFTLWLLAATIGAKEDKSQFFMTNSFLSTYSSNNPLATYTPVSKPLTDFQITNSFYDCLRYAEVGVDDRYKCNTYSVDTYKACVDGVVTTPIRLNTTVWEVRRVLGDYKGDRNDFLQLPSVFTSDTTFAQLGVILNNNDLRLSLKSQLALLATPLATDLLAVVTRSERATGVPGCLAATISNNAGMGLNSVANNLDLNVDSIFKYLWSCASDTIYTEPVQKLAYEKCFPLDTWPAKDVLQNPYTDTLFGSYNKYFLASLAAWFLCSFIVYTHPGMASNPTVNGKPEHFLARAGKFFVLFGFIWNCGALIMVFVRSFQPSDSWNNFPMSIQTVQVSLFFSITILIYFGRELYELFYLANERGLDVRKYTQMFAQVAPYGAQQVSRRLSGYMRVGRADAVRDSADESQYLPLVAPVWSDAFFFVDGLLFLSVVGNTPDVVTSDVVICVFLYLVVALTNSSIVRLLYEGYVNEVPPASTAYASNTFRTFARSTLKSSAERSLQAVRVMAMLANIMGLVFQIALLWVCITRFGFSYVTLFAFFSSTLPQVLWFALTLLLDSEMLKEPSSFLKFTMAIFFVNTLVRVAFVANMAVTYDYEFKLTVDNEDSLNNMLKLVGMEGPRNSAVSVYM